MGILSLCGLAAIIGAITLTSSPDFFSNLKAADYTTWKHFAAVMPTETESGIREYWSNCVGGEPVFEAPTNVTAINSTLTPEQINSILENKKDSRIIPNLERIQSGVNKHADGFSADDYTFVYDAYGYTFLDNTTKAKISGANESAIINAKTEFDRYFTVVYDAGKDNFPGKDQDFVSFDRGYDADKGDVLLITTTEGLSGKRSELYYYGIDSNGVTYDSTDVLSFSLYSPFPALANTSQTFWCSTYATAKKFNATPNGWTSINCTGNELNSDGKFNTAFTGSISLQRYFSSSMTLDPYQGTYKMTSIIARKNCGGAHNVNSWTTTKLPTIISEGVKEGRCSVCGEKLTAPVARLLSTASEIKSKIDSLPNTSELTMKNALDVAEISKALELLDSSESSKLSQSDLDKFNSVKSVCDDTWKVLYDPIINGLPTVRPHTNGTASVSYEFDNSKGAVLLINVEHTQESYLEDIFDLLNVGECDPKDTISMSVYTPFNTVSGTSQSIWFDTRDASKVQGLSGNNWTTISKTIGELSNDNSTSLNSFTLQRYYDPQAGAITEPYSGTYKVSSIVANIHHEEGIPTEENATIAKGANNISDVHTWGGSDVSALTFNVDTIYGKATQVDIKSKNTVLELRWDNVNYQNFQNFEYARMYVYAKTTQRVYVSLANWRNNVVSLPGIEPFASDNKARADLVQGTANVYADQWNIIDIPTSYFMQDTDSSFFIEIWNDVNEAKDGWLFTDLHGSNELLVCGRPNVYSNAEVSPYNDSEKGMTTKITNVAADADFIFEKTVDISSYSTLNFSIKNLSNTSVKFQVYKITASVYGLAVLGTYYQPDIKAQSWIDISINISELFGQYASQCYVRFKILGAAGTSCLITPIFASK